MEKKNLKLFGGLLHEVKAENVQTDSEKKWIWFSFIYHYEKNIKKK